MPVQVGKADGLLGIAIGEGNRFFPLDGDSDAGTVGGVTFDLPAFAGASVSLKACVTSVTGPAV